MTTHVADEELLRRCYCGWHPRGECPHCPGDLTLADNEENRPNRELSTVCQCGEIKSRFRRPLIFLAAIVIGLLPVEFWMEAGLHGMPFDGVNHAWICVNSVQVLGAAGLVYLLFRKPK